MKHKKKKLTTRRYSFDKSVITDIYDYNEFDKSTLFNIKGFKLIDTQIVSFYNDNGNIYRTKTTALVDTPTWRHFVEWWIHRINGIVVISLFDEKNPGKIKSCEKMWMLKYYIKKLVNRNGRI